MAAARVTRTNYHAPFRSKLYPSAPPAAAGGNGSAGRGSGGDSGLDVVRDNWDDSSDEEEEPPEGGGTVDGNTQEGAGRGDEEDSAGNFRGEPSQEQQHRQSDTDRDGDVENEGGGSGNRGGADVSSSPGITPSVAASAAPVAAPAAAAAHAPVSAAGSGKKSKWGNSAIKGRLSRPSDGRATTVEQEAAERRERIEKLR